MGITVVFSSVYFLFIFLPVVLLLYYAASPKVKNPVLLLASIFFYAWGEPIYVVLMLFSTVFNYVMGCDIAREKPAAAKKRSLVFAVVINLLILGFFKYYGFLLETINGIFPFDLPYRELPLPIGISFYTFQALSYIIDIYRGKVEVQKNFVLFAMYITMFPQLVAGPIVKYSDIGADLKERKITAEDMGEGIRRLIIGLGKKVLLANNLGLLYTAVQGMPERTVLLAWIGIIAYTMQIYFDFSGYSDMAIGIGRMLGFRFPENFRYPYLSTSVSEFWRRWHMTLSFWFRDYVYIPLGGSRVGTLRQIRNILIVWMLTGLWHGASWNFVLWGLYYGLLLMLEKFVLRSILPHIPNVIRHIYTMFFVIVGWVLFSNTDLTAALQYLGSMFGIGAAGFAGGTTFYYLITHLFLLIISVLCCAPALSEWFFDQAEYRPGFSAAVLVVIFLLSVAFLVYNSYNPFLYFRF